tara:strand:- start:2198 stop:4651 length:2454 start_codon:yes stop_codon:yes gene_type:complete
MPKFNSDSHREAMLNSVAASTAKKETDATWEELDSYTQDGLFIRVCPLNARPGVLESLAVYTKKDCRENLERIIKVMMSPDPATKPLYDHGLCEPDGCIMVQPFIDAHASAVMAPGVYDTETGEHTPGYIVMGRDNDGVTAALDGEQIVLPVSGTTTWVRQLWETLERDPSKYELEFVSLLKTNMGDRVPKNDNDALFATMHTKNMLMTENYITQLRGCAEHRAINPPPKGVTIQGFVPKGKVKVTEVYVCEGEMDDYAAALEERLAQKLTKGFVISHPDGNMASHAAAQARSYKIPYIISRVNEGDTWVEPAGGWVVKGTKFKAQPYDPVEYITEYKEGLTVGLHHWTRMYVHLGHHFHQFVAAPMTDPKTTAFLGGVYTGWLVNATLAVALGEMRHAKGQRRGNTPDVYGTLHAIFKGEWRRQYNQEISPQQKLPPTNRQDFYYTMETTPLNLMSLHGVFEWLVRMYAGGWGSSYGGVRYKESVQKGQALFLKATEFVSEPNEDNLLALIESTNICKNAVHNNGMFFNKFCLKSSMDMSTAKSGCVPDLNQMFNVYYAAQAALTKRRVKPELHDVTDTLNYILSRGPSAWAKTPIYLDESAPDHLKQAIQDMIVAGKDHYLHCGGGEKTIAGNKKFIPCGHPDCSVDKSHVQTLESIVQQEYQDAVLNVQAEIGLTYTDMGLQYDMWPIREDEGEISEQELWLIKTCEDIKTGAQEVEADLLVKCFNLAGELDATQNNVQPYVMKMLSKIISRMPTEERIPLLQTMTDVPVMMPEKIQAIDTLKGKTKANGKGPSKKTMKFLKQLQEELTQQEDE